MARVALVTGSRRGIGYGIATRLAAEGFDIVMNDVAPAEEVRESVQGLEKHGVRVLYCRADISKAEDRTRMLDEIQAAFGRIDLLVNNAGVAPSVRADLLDASEESYDRVMGINLKGPYFLTQAVARHMVDARKKGKKDPYAIVNISSVSSEVASVNRGEYCISKAGVSMATKLWAARLGEFDIQVYEVQPGIIKTDMTAAVTAKYDALIDGGLLIQKRWGFPEDIGKAVAMLARGDIAYSTGQIIFVDGGQLIQRL